MTLSDPKGGGGPECYIGPPAGATNRRLGGGAQGFSDGHGRGHGSCKNLNHHRAKHGLWVLHRLLHQLLHQVECYVAPILGPGTRGLKASRRREMTLPSVQRGADCAP